MRQRAKKGQKIVKKKTKKGKIFENLGKNVQNLKIFEKGQVIGIKCYTRIGPVDGHLCFPAFAPGPQFIFIGPGPQFVITIPDPQFVFVLPFTVKICCS